MVSIREAFNLMQGRAIRRKGAIPGDDAYRLRLNSLRNLTLLVGGDGLVKFALKVSSGIYTQTARIKPDIPYQDAILYRIEKIACGYSYKGLVKRWFCWPFLNFPLQVDSKECKQKVADSAPLGSPAFLGTE